MNQETLDQHEHGSGETASLEMCRVRLSYKEADLLLGVLASQYRILAPVRLPGRGRFSDQDAIRYGEIHSVGEIVHQERAHFSPKEVVFPISQTLFHLTEDEMHEPAGDPRDLLIFLRACDIHGFARLDDIFLRNGLVPDPYYARRREKVKFVLLECRQSLDAYCFCVAMGTNRTDANAMAVRFADEQLLIEMRDPALFSALPATAEPVKFTPEFPATDSQTVSIPDSDRLQTAIRARNFFAHPMWADYAKRCIACGRCNTHCVTCSCFTTYDIADAQQPLAGERRRVWAGCHIDRFTDMAGGHHFRDDNGSRMRYKTMHKIFDFHQRFGRHMCVGCGRCDAHCPEYLSFAECITRISHVLEEEG